MSDKQSIRFYTFQLKDDIEHAGDLLFMNSAYQRQQHLAVDGNNYKSVYQGDLNGEGQSTAEILESIYKRFNLHHPDDFRGHSLSVSDIVVLREMAGIRLTLWNLTDSWKCRSSSQQIPWKRWKN